MAVLKHIANKNADYGEAINYLLFQHDEESGDPILDEQGRMIMRKEFYMDGINCNAMDFDWECEQTNRKFHKNQTFNEIKSHHYIISFDPKDVTDHGLTGPKAQALCLDFAKKYFPGHQAIVATHTDGHHGSGNIHTHIVINSVRKLDVAETDFTERPCDHKAGYKHHLTKDYLKFLEKSVMEMCQKNGLHQVDLLGPAPVKITQDEYQAKRRGQKKLDRLNAEIIADGLKPRKTEFQTQKDKLRRAIDDIAEQALDFENFQMLLLEKYEIEANAKRGRVGYKVKDREKHITERALGSHYGLAYLNEKFEQNKLREARHESDYHKNPYAIFYFRSELRLVVDLQACAKAQVNEYYAQTVKISNLQHMAETLIYVQDHNYDTQDEMKYEQARLHKQLQALQTSYAATQDEIEKIKEQIRFTGQYFANHKAFQQMLHSENKGQFRLAHGEEIADYEEARKYLKGLHPDGKFPTLKSLYARKSELVDLVKEQKSKIYELGNREKELTIADSNVTEILAGREKVYTLEKEEMLRSESGNRAREENTL